MLCCICTPLFIASHHVISRFTVTRLHSVDCESSWQIAADLDHHRNPQVVMLVKTEITGDVIQYAVNSASIHISMA